MTALKIRAPHRRRPRQGAGPLTCALLAALAPIASQATEGGGSSYKPGVENYLSAASPPPGLYALAYANHYTADRLNDVQGQAIPVPGLRVRASVLAPRVVWVSPWVVAGGHVVAHAVLPWVDLSVSAAGRRDHAQGLGDVNVGSVLSWHLSPQLHVIAGVDVVLPTGDYDVARAANIGRNHRSVQPTVGLSRVDPQGFNTDVKLTATRNSRNDATQFRSGDELILDYAAGWTFTPAWTLGLGGYWYRQTSRDEVAGQQITGTEGRGRSIGPSVKYQAANGWFITAKWERETGQRNRTQGQQVWLKAAVPL